MYINRWIAVAFILLAHGINKHILRKTRAECVKQMLIFCTFLPNTGNLKNK